MTVTLNSPLHTALQARDSHRLVVELGRFVAELGVDALIDTLISLPEPEAAFARPHVVISRAEPRRAFKENRIEFEPGQARLSFAVPLDRRWDEVAGAWDPPFFGDVH